MPARPADLIIFGSDPGATLTDPGTGYVESGYSLNEVPASDIETFLKNRTDTWVVHLDGEVRGSLIAAGYPDGSAQGDTVRQALAFVGSGEYGDGSDGNVTIASGQTDLARDMYYQSLTVQSGGELRSRGFRIFVRGTMTVDAGGVVSHDGDPGANGSGGGAGGSGAPTGSVVGGADGGDGGSNAPGSAGDGIVNSIGGDGVAGESNPGLTNAGGSEGTVTAPANIAGGLRHNNASHGRSDGATSVAFTGGAGGGGGGGAPAFTGGGGGGGGGVLVVHAFEIVNNGTIRANGGAPGAGVASQTGSGGGGGGGAILLKRRFESGSGVFEVFIGGSAFANGTIRRYVA